MGDSLGDQKTFCSHFPFFVFFFVDFAFLIMDGIEKRRHTASSKTTCHPYLETPIVVASVFNHQSSFPTHYSEKNKVKPTEVVLLRKSLCICK